MKYWISTTLPEIGTAGMEFPYGGIPLFKDFFGIEGSLVYAQNYGAAWNLLEDHPEVLFILRLVLIGFLFVSFFRTDGWLKRFCLSLILVGALGNIFDTIVRGHVVDMFYFVFFGYSYPVFNVADIAIAGGVILLCFLPKPLAATSA